MKKDTSCSAVAKIDKGIRLVAKWFSYLGGLAIVFMALALFVNIVSAKVFGKAINNVNELVDYFLIAVVYCCVADCQFNGGLLQVDIFYRMFPNAVKKVIQLIGYVLGAGIYAYAGYQAFTLLNKHFTFKTLATSAAYSFEIWPFTLLYIVGSFFLALSLLWSIVTMFALPEQPEEQSTESDS